MSTPEVLDKRLERLELATQTILTEMRQRFAEQGKDIVEVKQSLTTLTTAVDSFAKIYADLNQEVVVMRQQLRDVEDRVGRLEFKLKTA